MNSIQLHLGPTEEEPLNTGSYDQEKCTQAKHIKVEHGRQGTQLFAVSIFAALAASCAPETRPESETKPTPWFEEIAAESGLRFRHSAGRERRYYMPENVAGGVALFDYDQDGDLDIYFVQAGDIDSPGDPEFTNALYRNESDGLFVDVTQEARVGDSGYGIGCTVGDYDADGDPDLYVTNLGANVLYRNAGDGTFEEVGSQAGVAGTSFSSSSAFGDFDMDGDLDLIVINYIQWSKADELECVFGEGGRDYCGPVSYEAPAPDQLYENQGDGTFRDISESAGLAKHFGNGLGVVLSDFDSNGSLDIYVTNDGNPNQLWLGDGQGHFVDRAVAWGCSVNLNGAAEAGMGVDAADYDGDGDIDLFMTHLSAETNTLYENRNGSFRDVTPMTGLSLASRDFTGFGVGFVDFNHDGYLDAYVANGRVKREAPLYSKLEPYAEPNQVFQGSSSGRFAEIASPGGTSELLVDVSRAAAFGDLDNDGDVDVVVNNSQGPPYVLLNSIGARESAIQFRVLNASGGYVLGAKVTITSDRGTQTQVVRRAFSYCASNDPRLHFGLGQDREVHSVSVTWNDGTQTEYGNRAPGQLHDLTR